jgi:CheY-like chemotaxis protein
LDKKSKQRLLIADDESGIRRLVRMTLASDDYEILEAADGDEALQVARTSRPSLVLLDVKMPRRSGLEVCKVLKNDPLTKDITVMMLTARTEPEDAKAGEAVGADHYMTKPFSPVALVRKVDEILGPRSRTASA